MMMVVAEQDDENVSQMSHLKINKQNTNKIINNKFALIPSSYKITKQFFF